MPNGQWELLNTIPGWSKGDNVPFEVQVGDIGGLKPQDGNVKIELDGDRNGNSSVPGGAPPDPVHSHATIEQTVNTAAGQNYELNFYYAARPDAGAGSSGLEVLWNGQVVYTIDPDTSTGWQQISLAVTATSTSSVLAFRAAGPASEENTLGAFIDNVRLTAVATVDEDGLASGAHDSQPGDANVADTDNDNNESTATGTLNIKWGADALDNPDAANANTSFVQDNFGRSLTFSNALVAVGGVAALTSHGEAIGYELSNNNSILTAKTASGREVFQVSLSDDGSGAFRFVLLDQLDHAPGQAENDLLLSFNYTATDSDGDSVSGRFSVAVDDDVPVAASEATQSLIEGTVVTGAFDFKPGADGAVVTHINGTALQFDANGYSQLINSAHGTLQVTADGHYTFTAQADDAYINGGTDSFVYTVTDRDGDTSSAAASFVVTDDADPVTVNLSASTAQEGGSATYLFTATLSSASQGTTTIVTDKGTITIADGQTVGTLSIPANNGEDVYLDAST